MSGSGGTGQGIRVDTQTPCENLIFETLVAAPDPEAVSVLHVGVILNLDLRGSGDGRHIAVLNGNQQVGSITERVPDLIRCMQKKFRFEAEVISIRGGLVQIQVRPAR